MKRVFLQFALLLPLITSYSYAQHGWVWQNPLPTSNPIVKIKFLNSSFGMGVGDFGSIIKTTNGGNRWISLNNFTSSFLKSLHIIDSLNIYVVGTDGSAFKTINSGQNWNKLNLGSTHFNDITFLNADTGFIVGQGRILKTTNGGNNWVITTTSIEFNSVFFVNNDTGFLAGSVNTIYKTTNCGINWISMNPELYGTWYSVFFYNEYMGFLFGSGRIIKTTNGGLNWSSSYYNMNESFSSFVQFQDSVIFVGGTSGLLLKTSNLGVNWVILPSGQGGRIISSIKIPNDSSISTLAYSSGQYEILSSTNNGINWSSQILGERGILNSVDFFNQTTGIVVGYNGTILRTTNCGDNWISISSGLNYTYTGAQMLSSGTGYICGPSNFIQKTTNYGINWTQINLTFSGSEYSSLSFINENTGFVVGRYNSQPRVLKTTNGGITFSNLNNGINTIPLLDVFMVDQNNIYISGYNIYKSTNGGANWVNVFTTSYQRTGLFFHNPDTGFVGGGQETYKTINGGINWYPVYGNGGASVFSIDFINELTGWAVGYTYSNTRILKTINGGNNWNVFNGITATALKDVHAINDTTVIAIGEGGTILKTTNGGGTIIGLTHQEIQIPNNFSLSQNYPNPFNPQTKIKFDVPKASYTKLIIYDLLGREVTTLVSEELKPGTYEADWDAAEFSSGVYFYKIIAGDFREIKKMVLMK